MIALFKKWDHALRHEKIILNSEEKTLLSYVTKLVTIETKGIELKQFHYALKAGLFLIDACINRR